MMAHQDSKSQKSSLPLGLKERNTVKSLQLVELQLNFGRVAIVSCSFGIIKLLTERQNL